jgi:molybdate transport system substrate-binding protein
VLGYDPGRGGGFHSPVAWRISEVPRVRFPFALVAALAAGVSSSGATPAAGPVELRIAAAASLRDVLQELAPALERATGARPVFNFAGSSELARQIVAANRADVFFSADEEWMDRVAEAGLVDAASRRSPLSNRLVVVVPVASGLEIHSAADLAQPRVRRLALAQPDAVPAGRYARAWLESAGQWSALAGRVIPALDVRAALAAVGSGAVDAGVVYRTDAAISARVRVAYEVPDGEGPRIAYALAAMRDRPHLELARRAVAWLCGPAAGAAFARRGFLVRSGPP